VNFRNLKQNKESGNTREPFGIFRDSFLEYFRIPFIDYHLINLLEIFRNLRKEKEKTLFMDKLNNFEDSMSPKKNPERFQKVL
jgi:hypothetical protein